MPPTSTTSASQLATAPLTSQPEPAPVPATRAGSSTHTGTGTFTMRSASRIVSPLYAAVLLAVLAGLAGFAGFAVHIGRDTPRSAASSTLTLATRPRSTPRPGRVFHLEIETMSQPTYFTCVYPHSNSRTQTASASSSVICESGPLVVGSLRSGSSAAQARAAAEESGYDIPPNYVSQPANNGEGWVFRAPGSSGNADIIRVGEANPLNPTGYVRYYNSTGQPLNWEGNTGPDSDTHLPLRSESGTTEDPLGDDFFDLGFSGTLGGIIYE